jgi:Flp pilus assembly protein TadB
MRPVIAAIMEAVIFLAGEWVGAWLFLSLAFLVAVLGVTGLGWWVLRGDAKNRAADEALETEAAQHH